MPGPEGQGPSPEDIGEGQSEGVESSEVSENTDPTEDVTEATPDDPAATPTPEENGAPDSPEEEASGAPATRNIAQKTGDSIRRGAAEVGRVAREKAGQYKERRNERKVHKREQKELNEQARNLAQARERRIKEYAEIIKHGARSPEELVQKLGEASFKDLKEAQERNKYGKGAVGKLKAFLAGEHDFEVQDDGTIEDHNTLKEAGRRVLSTVFNRRTAVSAGMLLGLGILTGGVGWAAGGVLLGGTAGRGLAEMGELFAGKTREARENVLFAERARWDRMRALALETQGSPDDPARQGQLVRELVELMYRQGDNVLIRDLVQSERNLEEREAKFNKLRNRLQTAGELVGAAAGLTSILNGGVEHLDMDMFNKIDGQSVFHGVQQSQEGWQFLYSSGAEAGQAVYQGAAIQAGGAFGAHALAGATTAEVLAYTIGERTVPMLLASGLAWWSEKGKRPAGESAQDVIYRSNKAERLNRQIGTASEYIRKIADENRNPVPKNPEGFAYNWNEQPKSFEGVDIDQLDHWYLSKTVDGVDLPTVDPATGKIINVAVLGVDVENNRIAYARFERTDNGATHQPVEIRRLDKFLEQFHLHKEVGKGVPFSVDGMDIAQGEARKDTETDKKHIENVEGAKYPIGYEAKFGKSAMTVAEIDMSGKEPRYRLAASVPSDQPDGGASFSVWRTESQMEKKASSKQSEASNEAPQNSGGSSGKGQKEVKQTATRAESNEPKRRAPLIRIPENFYDNDKYSFEERMHWLGGLPNIVGDEVMKAAGVEVGRVEPLPPGPNEVRRFARYTDERGIEYILSGKDDSSGRINFMIWKGPVGGRQHSLFANPERVNDFIGSMLGRINAVIRTEKYKTPDDIYERIEEEERAVQTRAQERTEGGRVPIRVDNAPATTGRRASNGNRPLMVSIGDRVPGLDQLRDILPDGPDEQPESEPAGQTETKRSAGPDLLGAAAEAFKGGIENSIGANPSAEEPKKEPSGELSIEEELQKLEARLNEPDSPPKPKETPPPEGFKLGPAIWKGAQGDIPVVVDMYLGEMNGKHYVKTEGSPTGIDLNEIVYEGQPVGPNPEATPPKEETDLERLGISNPTELVGKEIRFNNIIDFLEKTGAVLDDDPDSDVEYSDDPVGRVKNIDAGMAVVSVNNKEILVDIDELIPYISSVK